MTTFPWKCIAVCECPFFFALDNNSHHTLSDDSCVILSISYTASHYDSLTVITGNLAPSSEHKSAIEYL